MRQLTSSAQINFDVGIAMTVLTTVSVAARFVVRASRRQAPNGADWLCLLSLALFYAFTGLIFNYILNVSLYGSFDILPERGLVEFRNILKLGFQLEILFGIIITAIKLSILWFYYSIFGGANSAFNKRLIYGATAACVVWFIVATFFVIFQCMPVDAYWNKFLDREFCRSGPTTLFGYEITNCVLDFVLLLVPIPIIWRLKLDRSKKLGILAIFMVGSLVCVASIVRITHIYKPPNPDLNFDFSGSMEWSSLQLGVAITCSCLPSLGPVFYYITAPCIKLSSRAASYFSARSTSRRWRSGGGTYKISEADHEMVSINKKSSAAPMASVEAPFSGSGSTWISGNNDSPHGRRGGGAVPPSQIMVNHDIEVV